MRVERREVEILIRTALSDFHANNLLDKPSKIVLAPRMWSKFVCCFHHECTPTELAREMKLPQMRKELGGITYAGVSVALAAAATSPEVVVVGTSDLDHYATTWGVLSFTGVGT